MLLGGEVVLISLYIARAAVGCPVRVCNLWRDTLQVQA
jgi:hypothetical protein